MRALPCPFSVQSLSLRQYNSFLVKTVQPHGAGSPNEDRPCHALQVNCMRTTSRHGSTLQTLQRPYWSLSGLRRTSKVEAVGNTSCKVVLVCAHLKEARPQAPIDDPIPMRSMQNSNQAGGGCRNSLMRVVFRMRAIEHTTAATKSQRMLGITDADGWRASRLKYSSGCCVRSCSRLMPSWSGQ